MQCYTAFNVLSFKRVRAGADVVLLHCAGASGLVHLRHWLPGELP